MAYTDLLQDNVHGASSSIVCLPEVDAGGYGPKMESWAFALSIEGELPLCHSHTIAKSPAWQEPTTLKQWFPWFFLIMSDSSAMGNASKLKAEHL